jgi:hypothetical protein
MNVPDWHAVPASIACIAAFTLIALIVLGAW